MGNISAINQTQSLWDAQSLRRAETAKVRENVSNLANDGAKSRNRQAMKTFIAAGASAFVSLLAIGFYQNKQLADSINTIAQTVIPTGLRGFTAYDEAHQGIIQSNQQLANDELQSKRTETQELTREQNQAEDHRRDLRRINHERFTSIAS